MSAESPPDHSAVLREYQQRADSLRERRRVEARATTRLGYTRLAAFAIAALLIARWASTGGLRWPWALATIAVLIGFGLLVRASHRAAARLQFTDDCIALALAGAARVRRAWSELRGADWAAAGAAHPYAADLDLFGEASLAALFPPMSPAPGRPLLRQWMLEPAAAADISRRQDAILELRDHTDFRNTVAAAAMHLRTSESGVGALVAWAEAQAWIANRPALVAATILLPLLTLSLIVVQIVTRSPAPWWLAPLVASWAFTGRYARQLGATFAPLAARATALRQFSRSAHVAAEFTARASLLQALQRELMTPTPAHRAIGRLTTLADCADLRLSPMLYAVVHSLTLWDFHVAHLLERWRNREGRRIAPWLDALAQVEALCALATLAHDNPDWCLPELDPQAPCIEVEGLGHPLLAPDVGVRNDLTVGPAGSVLVVTGSNMAGKSTLLRALGLNLVLAQAGAPVCAHRFRHPPAALHTSMRVQDSLARGVSYFMAELERLKSVVEGARTARAQGDRRFVYLLDEILHGTNSVERAIAGRQVLLHLVASGAIGAVSTHDLQLVDDPALGPAAKHVHFSEQFTGSDGAAGMTFDYRLRPGKATSSNALVLLELAGLGTPGPAPQ